MIASFFRALLGSRIFGSLIILFGATWIGTGVRRIRDPIWFPSSKVGWFVLPGPWQRGRPPTAGPRTARDWFGIVVTMSLGAFIVVEGFVSIFVRG